MATFKTITGKLTGPDGSPVSRPVVTVSLSQSATIPITDNRRRGRSYLLCP
jgi:hypothetical protein